ncbi:MAG: cysteine desulfurase [Chloroflexi bacterium]|nr:cysteine desulfurase [Chloroflexota bacterium]
MENPKTYLDYAATTPVDSRVVEVMLPYFSQIYGNSSSIHFNGQQAETAIENSRETIANIINCKPEEIVFTSGGTESDNLAIRGVAFASREKRRANHLLITPVEHHAVSNTALQLAKLHNFDVEYLPVNKYGQVRPDDVSALIRKETALVSIILANNEIGTINEISEIGSICQEMALPLHTDAVQAAAYLPINVNELNVDLMSIGAHKFYGPKGVGVLYIRDGTPILPIQTGGDQEMGLRAGTPNAPYIVGMAEAFHISHSERDNHNPKNAALRDRIIEYVLEEIPDSKLTGHPIERLPNHASFLFHGVDGNMLLTMLDVAGFACSSGSACKTGSPEPSDVLLALGYSHEWAFGSLRVTLGRQTTRTDIDSFLSKLPELVAHARKGVKSL